MLLNIEPLDTLFFRDGRPFTKEEDSWASSLTWPLPGTIYGALRSAYWSQHPALLRQLAEEKKLNTDQDPTRRLRITGLAISWQNTVYWPLPLDVRLREKRHDTNRYNEQEKGEYRDLLLPSLQSNDTHHPHWAGTSCTETLPMARLTYSEPVEEIENGLIESASLIQYLNGHTPHNARSLTCIYTTEPRTGIGLDHQTRRVREKMLYRLGMNRYIDVRFLVECHGLWEKENRSVFPLLLRLGGEGKAAICQYEYEDEEIQSLHPELPAWPASDSSGSAASAAQALFKLYLATPAIFQNGWLPSFIDPTTLKGTYCGINLQLVAAVVGKPLLVSGFDMNHRYPKPLRRAVPAGSVYYFQLAREQAWSRVIQNLHGRCISDERPREGFGLCLIGRVPSQ